MKVTITDIAEMANVSKASVSRVLNNKPDGVSEATREKILKLIDEVDFQPSMIARSLVTKKTKTIGIIIPDITNPFFPQLVRGAEDCANKLGYQIFLSNSDNNIVKEENYLKGFIEKSVDGVILTSNASEDNFQHQLLKKSGIPFVLLDRHLESKDYAASVYLDNVKGAYLAADLLLSRSHSKIALITGPLSVATSVSRLKGYEKAFLERGAEIHRDIIVEGEYSIESGFRLMNRLMDENKDFTAVFACNDMTAIGAIKALKARGRTVPGDAEVIGFDNIDIAQILDPALSTVAQPAYAMGEQGASLLIRLIEGKRLKKKNVVLEPELILRETTRT